MKNKNFSKITICYLLVILTTGSLLISLTSCKEKLSAEDLEYITYIEKDRKEKDSLMQYSDTSPFNFKGKVEFHPLKYFTPDPAFVFNSKLYEYEKKDTVIVFGTKGDERRPVRFGRVTVNYNEHDHKIHVYQGESKSGNKYYMIWFTDNTTNKESYGVGRYLNFEKADDPDFVYTIDFNEAYNPYCAYTKDYSCSIPTKDDYIDMAIAAGEKKFHD